MTSLRPHDYGLVLDYDYVKDGRRRRGYEVWVSGELVAKVRKLESGAWCANRVGTDPAGGAVAKSRHQAIAEALA